jgi:hypothetical protein
MKTIGHMIGILALAFISSCNSSHNKPSGADGWLKGDESQKLKTIAKHLRGFVTVKTPVERQSPVRKY